MSDSVQDKLAALQKRYAASLPDKCAEFDQAWALFDQDQAEDALAQLRHLAHKLAGSGASYGFDALSRDARALEHRVIDQQEQGADPEALKATFAALQQTLIKEAKEALGG